MQPNSSRTLPLKDDQKESSLTTLPESRGVRVRLGRRTASQLRPIADQMARTTRRFLRSFQENLQLATILACIAGFINAVAFLEFGTFVSHITGNATHAAIDYAGAHKNLALLFLLEILCFISGAFLTSFLLRGHTAASSRVKYTAPVLLEAALLAGFMLLASSSSRHSPAITALLSWAMGMQNAMLRQTSGAIVRTTHMTGVATDIGIELGAALSSGLYFWRKKPKGSRFFSFLAGFLHRLGLGRFAFQAAILASFIAGGVIGALGYQTFKISSLLFPTLILTVLGLREHLRPKPA